MKKFLRIICLTFVSLLICTGIGLMHRFPIDTQPYVEKKYAGWNGVLQAWICTRWNPGGSFIQWLNRCASAFEKNHEGVYLEFTPVQAETIEHMNASSLPLPDLIFFSPGVARNPDAFVMLQYSDLVRSDLRDYGNGRATPVALSGYIWAYNTALREDVPRDADSFTGLVLPKDGDGQCFSAALLGLLSSVPGEQEDEFILPDSGIDLGLPTSSMDETLYSADAMDLFLDGELSCIPVDAKALAQLNRQRENGRGPDWKPAGSGEIACTDQVLMAAIPEQADSSGRAVLASEFITSLLAEDAQAALADIGAFSVTGECIHSDFSVYAEMDVLLNSRRLWLPSCFSEYSASNPEGIVRSFLRGELSAKNALSLLGFEEV